MNPGLPLEATLAQAIGHYNAGRREAAAALCAALPAHPAVQQLQALLAHERGDLAQARRLIDASLAARPDHLPSLSVLGTVALDQGDAAAAERALNAVLAQQPQNVAARVNLGIALLEQGRLDAAMQAFGRAYTQRPETFGRIANALATPACGALWLDPEALREALRQAA